MEFKGLHNNNKKTALKLNGLSKTVKSSSCLPKSKPRTKRSKYREFQEKDNVLNIYNEEGVNLTEFIKDKTIYIVNGTTPAHHKEAKVLAKSKYELFFEVFNVDKEHIGYGVQIR